ncbi:Cls Phosphatidylserine/phosphatidylglycerophosphate/ cardiolipin synthases and related enzymes [Methylophilaceae bacterium]
MMQFIAGNQIKLLRSGGEYFPALRAAINNAQLEIYLQTYIFQADETGQSISLAMMAAAERGVRVNLLLDGFGSQKLDTAHIANMRAAGVNVLFYRARISPWSFKKNRLRRLHSKMAVIDGTVGFIGGINIIDDNNVPNPNNVPPRVDYAVQIEGALLPRLQASVADLWQRVAWLNLLKTPASKSIASASSSGHLANLLAAFVQRDNVLHRHDIETAYLEAINSAHNEILIANAYFLPGYRFRKALVDAANRGVKVSLLLQGRVEYFLMMATHAFYSEFLNKGIAIYEYRKSFMHSKVAVIDGTWATVGSSNIDPFSLLLAREANLFISDPGFAGELRTDILASIEAGAVPILAHQWQAENALKRAASKLALGMVRLFLGLIGEKDE